MAWAPVPLHVDAVSKRVDRTIALDSVSFGVRAEISGALGPNDAGKTALIRTILDVMRPDAGRIELFGRAFQREDRNRITYLPEERPYRDVGSPFQGGRPYVASSSFGRLF